MTAKSRKPLLENLTWAAALLIASPLLYVLSFGPACLLTSQVIVGGWVTPHRAMVVYWPLGQLAADTDSQCGVWLRWWMTFGVKNGHSAVVPTAPSGSASLALDAD